MNKITLKKSTHRNFMSYGDIPNEFTFHDGVMLMTAANGSGKSAIIEVISFALFGTSYRGGNKGDLRNTNNTTATMEVSLEFDVDHGDGEVESYRIFRTVDPKEKTRFDVEKLVDGKWERQNKRAGYVQKDFEDKILGFNEVLFKNVIAMNTQESTPFIDMPAAKRRELLESIIDMSTEYWKRESGRMLSSASTACDIASSDISRISGEISNLENICNTLRNEKQANIEQLEANLLDCKAKIDAVSSKVADVDGKMAEKMTEINGYSAEVSKEPQVDAEISRISAAGECVTRLSAAEEALADAQKAYAEALTGYSKEEHDGYVSESRSLNSELSSLQGEISRKENETHMIQFSIGNSQKEMDRVTEQGKNLKPGVPCPTCGKPSTAEDIEPHRQELLRQWKEFRQLKLEAETNLADRQTEIANLTEKRTELETRIAEVTANADRLNKYYYSTVVPASTLVSTAERNLENIRTTIAAAGMDTSQFTSELSRLQGEKARFAEIRVKWQDAYNEYTPMQAESARLHGELNGYTMEADRISGDIERARNANSADALAVAEGKLAEAKGDLESATSRLHEQSDLKAGYTYINKNLCSDDGMKKMLFGIFVPAFNKSVQKNIIHTGLPFTVEFDDTMSYQFVSAPGLSPKYVMLSQGQKRRLGFAIAMAFRDFVAMVGNFSINLLSLDEVLDISTDDEGMRDMMDIVRSMVGEIGCALVITHRVAAVLDKFDYWVTIENDGIYSSIGEMKKL